MVEIEIELSRGTEVEAVCPACYGEDKDCKVCNGKGSLYVALAVDMYVTEDKDLNDLVDEPVYNEGYC